MVPPLTKEGYDKLCNASRRFLQEDSFGIPPIETVMEAIFGDYTQRITSVEAKSNDTMDDAEYLFNHPDPYGMIAAGNQEDSDPDDNNNNGISTFPTVSQAGIDARRLQISELVDLENMRLLSRYDDKRESTRGVLQVRVQQSQWSKLSGSKRYTLLQI
jgi:hypothetical protein